MFLHPGRINNSFAKHSRSRTQSSKLYRTIYSNYFEHLYRDQSNTAFCPVIHRCTFLSANISENRLDGICCCREPHWWLREIGMTNFNQWTYLAAFWAFDTCFLHLSLFGSSMFFATAFFAACGGLLPARAALTRMSLVCHFLRFFGRRGRYELLMSLFLMRVLRRDFRHSG